MVGGRVDLSPRLVKELSLLRPARAVGAIALDWLVIAGAIGLCVSLPNPVTYLVAVIVVGSRQHALGIIGHDASHFRLLPQRWLNELVGNVLLMWPLLLSLGGYRAFHLPHHQHLNETADGNRILWQTHSPEGEIEPDWAYPKDRRDFAAKIVRYTFLPVETPSGVNMVWAMFQATSLSDRAKQLAFLFGGAVAFTVFGWWLEFLLFWLVPMTTWSKTCNYLRTVAEHSAVRSDDPAFAETRTTIAKWWEAALFLPHNIGYHIEHHLYPSVPFYNLPALHRELMKDTRFRARAAVSHSFWASMQAVTKPRTSAAELA